MFEVYNWSHACMEDQIMGFMMHGIKRFGRLSDRIFIFNQILNYSNT